MPEMRCPTTHVTEANEPQDPVYAAALEMMRRNGESAESLPSQRILLRDGHFYGYLFVGERVRVIWTVEDRAFSVSLHEEVGETASREPKPEHVSLPKRRRAA